MADQTTQSLIQSIAQANPVSANNGNPNTVYNTAAGAVGAIPAQNLGPGWNGNLQIAPAANLAPLALQRSDWAAPTTGWEGDLVKQQNAAQVTIPQNWADILKNQTPAATPTPVTPTPVTPTPTPAQPTVTPWTVPSGLILGGNKKPQVNAALYANDPAYKAAWDELAAFHKYSPDKAFTRGEDVNKLYSHLTELYSKYKTQQTQTNANGSPVTGGQQASETPVKAGSGLGNGLTATGTPLIDSGLQEFAGNIGNGITGAGAKGWNSNSSSPAQSASNLSNAISNGIAAVSNGTGTLMQMFDAISEPWLPGNLYMSQTGKMNTANIVKMLGNIAVPGLGSLAGLIASKIPDSVSPDSVLGQIRDFFIQGKMDEWANAIKDDLDKNYDKAAKDSEKQLAALAGGYGGGSEGSGGGGAASGGWGFGSAGEGGSARTGSVTVKDPQVVRNSQ